MILPWLHKRKLHGIESFSITCQHVCNITLITVHYNKYLGLVLITITVIIIIMSYKEGVLCSQCSVTAVLQNKYRYIIILHHHHLTAWSSASYNIRLSCGKIIIFNWGVKIGNSCASTKNTCKWCRPKIISWSTTISVAIIIWSCWNRTTGK